MIICLNVSKRVYSMGVQLLFQLYYIYEGKKKRYSSTCYGSTKQHIKIVS